MKYYMWNASNNEERMPFLKQLCICVIFFFVSLYSGIAVGLMQFWDTSKGLVFVFSACSSGVFAYFAIRHTFRTKGYIYLLWLAFPTLILTFEEIIFRYPLCRPWLLALIFMIALLCIWVKLQRRMKAYV